MIILDIAKELKLKGYEYAPTNTLVNVIRDAFNVIHDEACKQGGDFSLSIPRFGTFKVLQRKARVGFNPQTKEKINIPEKWIFKLRTSGKFKEDLVNLMPKKGKAKKEVNKEKKTK